MRDMTGTQGAVLSVACLVLAGMVALVDPFAVAVDLHQALRALVVALVGPAWEAMRDVMATVGTFWAHPPTNAGEFLLSRVV